MTGPEQSQGPSHLASDLLSALKTAVGSGEIIPADQVEREQWHDRWVLNDLDDLEQTPLVPAFCLALPRTVEEVAAVINECRNRRVSIVPQGLRSGVCGAVRATAGAVHLDCSRLDSVGAIDPHNLTARFGAGVRGSDAEEAVNALGLTIGHFPQSIELSSVGGWVATRAAGQYSTGYGNIEDILLSLQAVLADGSIVRLGKPPRAAAGPDLRQLLLGSEGTLGVITEVELALHRQPEQTTTAAFYVPDMATGFNLQRNLLGAEWRPSVLRQYDNKEVLRLFPKFRQDDQGLLLVVHQGPATRVAAEVTALRELAAEAGCAEAPSAATDHWLKQRNHVPTFRSFLENGIMVDTIEVAAPYDRILDVYNGAVQALSEIDGIWNGSAHSSHAYRNGLNLYFSFAVKPGSNAGLRQAYNQCWDAVLQATVGAGGTIAHHHGIGRVRRNWLERELEPNGLAMLRAIKGALDPTGLFNPGVLLPDPR